MQLHIFAVSVALTLLTGATQAEVDPEILQVGMVESLVKDLSPGKRKLLGEDFPELVKEFTGYKSQLHQGGDPLAAGNQLATGKWHFAVFHGVEFAWAQAKNPKLLPLTVAIGKEGAIHALLVEAKDTDDGGFAGLKGKNVHILLGKAHCTLYTEKNSAGKPNDYFGKVVPTSNPEEALDNILRGKVQGAIVDNVALGIYESINPGRFARLKVTAKSEPFPATVIGYCQGVLAPAALAKFRMGILKAHESEKGRDALANFRVTRWVAPPGDYAQQLSAILKSYPGK